MPKFLLGCLLVLAVAAVAGLGAGYFLLFKPAYQFVTDVGGFATEFAALSEQVQQDPQFRPPTDGSVDEAQFARFMAAQRDIRSGMDRRLPELQSRWQSMQAEIERRDGQANILELITASQDLTGLLLDAKRHQVEALNRHDFSLQEYLYVRNQTFLALGMPVAVAGVGDQGPSQGRHPVPADTREMIRPHQEELKQSYALAWFGL